MRDLETKKAVVGLLNTVEITDSRRRDYLAKIKKLRLMDNFNIAPNTEARQKKTQKIS